MTETMAAAGADVRDEGLAARLVGVLFSPRATYAGIAARPRILGALAVSIVIIMASQYAFLASDTGRELAIEQQVEAMEAFGMTVTDEMYAQIETNISQQSYLALASTLVFVPVVTAAVAGILVAIFSMVMGGSGTFRQVYALLAHAGIITVLQQLVVVPLSLASGRMAGASLGVFVPMLDERSFIAVLLGSINLFYVWWMVNLAIGLGVLYRRRTGPIAIALLSVYAVGALAWAAFRSGS